MKVPHDVGGEPDTPATFEDRLSRELYPALPFPENQLVALAHSLVAKNVIDEAALAEHMNVVRARLEAAGEPEGSAADSRTLSADWLGAL